MGNNIKLQDLDLSLEEERDIIGFITQKRGVTTKKLLSTIKPNLERKNNQILTPKKPLKKTERKNNQILTPEKPLKNPKPKSNQNLTPEKPLKNPKSKDNQNLTPEKPLKNPKPKNNQNLTSKNKERIGIIREELKELGYKLSKSELKEIKRCLYIVENKQGSLNSRKTPKISR